MNKNLLRVTNSLAVIFLMTVSAGAVLAQNPVTLVEEPQKAPEPAKAQEIQQPNIQATPPQFGQQPQPSTGGGQVQVDEANAAAASGKEEEITQENLEMILKNQGIPLTPGNVDLVGSSNYTLGANDVIEVTVMRHPEVSGQFIINNEGNIQYEFVGDVPVIGLTKKGVADLLESKLGQYIISPEVNVKIVGYNSKVVYVIGEVGRPGKIYMQGDTITVREALVQAGLPLLSAKTGKSKLITPSANAKPETKNINVQKLLYEGDLRENLVMKPGDTLYIPPTLLSKAMRAISPVAQPIGEAAGTGRTVMAPF